MAAFPVEIVNLESEVWTGPAITTLVVSLLALLVSLGSVIWQTFTWRRDGALVKVTAYVRPGVPYRHDISSEGRTVMHMLGQPARHVVIARNEGRQDAFVGPLFLAIGNDLRDRTLVQNLGTFPGVTQNRELMPGDYAEALIDPEEIWAFCESFEVKLRQVRFVTDSHGRPNSIKFPREFRKELMKFKPGKEA